MSINNKDRNMLNNAFNGIEINDIYRVSVGGVKTQDIARNHGTPLFVIDGDLLTERVKSIKKIFARPRFRIYYSVKANANLSIIRRVLDLGLCLDLCSEGDVHLAELSGARSEQLSYTGVALDERKITALVRSGIHLNLDSLSEARAFARVAPGRPVGIRVAPDVEAGFHPYLQSGLSGGKFGIAIDQVDEALAILESSSCRLRCLHAHLGSSIDSPGPYLEALDVLLELAVKIKDVSTINLGGGIAPRYHPDDVEFPLEALRDGINDRISTFESENRRTITVELEPGEYLVSEAGYLLSSVQIIKSNKDGGPHSAIVDASMNLLPAHSLYGTYHRIWVDGKRSAKESGSWNVYGCTNQTGDRLASERSLPELSEGDILVFGNAGAYAFSRSTHFNQRPRPAEVWVEGGNVRVVREPESTDDLARGQDAFSRSPLRPRFGGIVFNGAPPRSDVLSYKSINDAANHTGIEYQIDDIFRGRVSVDWAELGRPSQEEAQVLDLALAGLVAQYALPAQIVGANFGSGKAHTTFNAILEMLYDIRAFCDEVPYPDPPGMSGQSIKVTSTDSSRCNDRSVLVLLSGGFDSTYSAILLKEAGYDVKALHVRCNRHVEEVEEESARAIATALDIPLYSVHLNAPDQERIGRYYSRTFGQYPFYNSIPHGRDFVLVTLAAIAADRLECSGIALGHEKESRRKVLFHGNRKIYRHDAESSHGTSLARSFVRHGLRSSVNVFSPVAGLSIYRIRASLMRHYPEIAKLVQSCFWSRRCGKCLKCLSAYTMDRHLGTSLFNYDHNLFADRDDTDMALFAEPDRPSTALAYGPQMHYAMAHIITDDLVVEDDYWLKQFETKGMHRIAAEWPLIEDICTSVEADGEVPRDVQSVIIDSNAL